MGYDRGDFPFFCIGKENRKLIELGITNLFEVLFSTLKWHGLCSSNECSNDEKWNC